MSVSCQARGNNFGRTCVTSHPNEPERWCDDCRDRRELHEKKDLTDHRAPGLVDRMARHEKP